MTKKLIGGIWVPESETHLVHYLETSAAKSNGVGSYQLHTLGAMMDYVSSDRRNLVLDIGGHVGLWSMHFAKYFTKVVAFEPVPVLRECFVQNVQKPNVELRPYGLGDINEEFDISFERDNSGHTHILPSDPTKHIDGATLIRVPVKRLDDEEFDCVDAIKIDVEGFEPAVIRGAEKTIKKHRPIICMEQKPHNFYEWEQFYATRLLMSWGARPVRRVVDDYIFIWN
jgi:FkbM family methyltransferase